MLAFVSKCRKGVQNIYAGDLACNKRVSNPISNYKYNLLTISSTFDADYYHQNREPIISIDKTIVVLEEDATIEQEVVGTAK